MRPGTDGALALGIANLMIERGWYDRDFIRDWSNGPLLVRADTGRLLTATRPWTGRRCSAVSSPGTRRGAVWSPYDTATGRYDGATPHLALEGEYRIATPDGEVVCQPAFELYAALCRRYPPEGVEAICWIPRGAGRGGRAADLASRARSPTTPGAGTSSTPTSPRPRAPCRCSTR